MQMKAAAITFSAGDSVACSAAAMAVATSLWIAKMLVAVNSRS